jgi:hypothetical protein
VIDWDCSFGTLSLTLGEGWYPDDVPQPGTLWSDGDPILFSGADFSTYVFLEYNVVPDNSSSSPIYVTTNRTITASGVCSSWPVIAGGDGSSQNIAISSDGHAVNKTLPIAGGTAQTTFGTNPNACKPTIAHSKKLHLTITARLRFWLQHH